MRFRTLRIAFSAVCGIVCLLLIALWVRSYWWFDRLATKPWLGYQIQIDQAAGSVRLITDCDATISDPALIGFHSSEISGDLPLDDEAILGFNIWREHSLRILHAPHWFFVIGSALLTAAPWLRWRFSLRTLLIAMTLVAVLLGTVIALSR